MLAHAKIGAAVLADSGTTTMFRFAVVICCTCWGYLTVRIFGARPDTASAVIWSGIELIFFTIGAIALYVCRKSRTGLGVLSALCLLSLLAATVLLIPPLTPPSGFGNGILVAWCLFLQVIFAEATVFVCAYVTDTPVRYRTSDAAGGKLLAAILFGVPALFLLALFISVR